MIRKGQVAGKIVLADMVAADCTDAGGKLSMISFGADATLFFNPCCRLGRRFRMNMETSRLILRRPSLADVPRLFAFLGDAEAMRHTHLHASLRECRRRVAIHEWRRRRDGYAPWTIVTKADGQIIGWGGLYDDPFDPGWGVEVGYYFDPAAWGRGYATELIMACTSLADDVLHLPEVHAFARPENGGSRRVLEKAGFEVVRFVAEMDRFLYRRGRQDRRLAAWPLPECRLG